MKYNIKTAIFLAKLDFYYWVLDLRTISVGMLLLIFLHMNTHGLVGISETFEMKFSPWIFPFIMSTRIIRMVIYLFSLFLLCDVGKQMSNDFLIRVRVYPRVISASHLLALLWKVGVYWTVILISPIMMYFSNIKWTLRWGRVLGYLARVADYEVLGEFAVRFSGKITDGYSPVMATSLSFLLACMSTYLLGVILLFFNSIFMEQVGIVVTIMFVLLDFILETDIVSAPYLLPISFSTYSNLAYIGHYGSQYSNTVSLEYAFLFLIFGILLSVEILMFLRWGNNKKRRK